MTAAVPGEAVRPRTVAGGGGTAGEPDPLVSLNFLVHRDFRRRVKRHAVDAGITQKELLHQAIEAWEEKHGLGPAPGGG